MSTALYFFWIAIARIPLIPPGEPQHEAVEHPEESAETNEPTDTQQIEITDIETLYTPEVPIDYTPTQIIDDEVGSLRLRDELLTLAENSSSRRQSCARLLLSFLDKGIDSFTVDDISSGCGITLDQAGNLVNSLKDKGLIESGDRRVGKMMVYRFGRDLPPLKPDDYSKEILRTISKLLNSHKSAKDRRIGELIFSCIHKGLITSAEYSNSDSYFSMSTELALLVQMGILTKLNNGMYRINRAIPEILPPLTALQRTAVNALYESYHDEQFSTEMAMTVMRRTKDKTYVLLRQLTMLGVLEKQESSAYTYRMLVNPNDNPVRETICIQNAFMSNWISLPTQPIPPATDGLPKTSADALRKGLCCKAIMRRGITANVCGKATLILLCSSG